MFMNMPKFSSNTAFWPGSAQVAALGCLAGLLVISADLQAQPIPVSNHSFESQVVNPVFFVDPRIDSWQKAPQPGYFTNSPQLTWDQTVGMFIGTPPFSA